MFIRTVDDGLARMLRAEIPLPGDDVDIAFCVPTTDWFSGLSRTTVNFFLYDVGPSTRPIPTPHRRVDQDGFVLRRRALPIVDLNYLVSVWSADALREHEVLGLLVGRFAAESVLPPEHLPDDADYATLLTFGGNEQVQTHELWRTVDGGARSSFRLTVSTAADSFDWTEAPAPVTSVVHHISRSVD